MSHWIVFVFTFGTSIFFALSMIERSTWSLMWKPQSSDVSEGDIRFVHKSLQRLTSVLPPSNGLVILGGTTLLVIQVFERGWSEWDFPSAFVLVLYWSFLLYIVLIRKNPEVVLNLRRHDSYADDIALIRADVSRVQIDHHLGLIANASVVVLQLSFLTTY